MDEDELDLLFLALSSQPRRVILDAIRRSPGCRPADLLSLLPMSRMAVMKHLNVLEAAQLIVSRKLGRERLLWFNAVPIEAVHQMWTDSYQQYFAGQLLQLKAKMEAPDNRQAADGRLSHFSNALNEN